jgi:uroporphyrinogen decarboxylase
MTSRERVLNAMNNKPVDRIPFSFWFHFLRDEHIVDGMRNPELMEQNYRGHKWFVEEVQPDFVKIMSDGLFRYPGIDLGSVRRIDDLADIRELDDQDPWIDANVAHVSRVVALDADRCYFYNVFSPSMLLRIYAGEERYFELLREDARKFAEALEVMARGIAKMVRGVLSEGGADGIFFCAQNTNIDRLSDAEYAEYIRPSDFIVLDAANALSENNILHICGYEGRRNRLEQWVDYRCRAVNWAVNVEGVGIAEGRKLFGDRAAIGGFVNTVQGVLYTGGKEQIEAWVDKFVAEAGSTGTMLAADCSLPHDIDPRHLIWVREKLETLR